MRNDHAKRREITGNEESRPSFLANLHCKSDEHWRNANWLLSRAREWVLLSTKSRRIEWEVKWGGKIAIGQTDWGSEGGKKNHCYLCILPFSSRNKRTVTEPERSESYRIWRGLWEQGRLYWGPRDFRSLDFRGGALMLKRTRWGTHPSVGRWFNVTGG